MRRIAEGVLSGLLFALSFLGVVLTSGMTEPRQRAASGALEALSFWSEARAYPYADIPADKYYEASRKARELSRTTPFSSQGSGPWELLGPSNFSGRMISVAIDPTNASVVYVGSASGGLWRSTSGGLQSDWRRISTGFPVLGVGAIAINPLDPSTLYIGTGETYSYGGSVGGMVVRTTRGSYGMGILKSTDNGATWTQSLDRTYNNRCGVQAIRINPVNPNTVLAATSEGVHRSVNAGASWEFVLNVVMAQDILINPIDTTLVLVSCGNFGSAGAGFYRSSDGGVNFDAVGGVPHYSGKALLEMFVAHPNVVYASIADSIDGYGGLWRSTDFGLNWEQISNAAVHGVQGWYSHFVAVHPSDSSRVVRAGQVSVFTSTDGGVTVATSCDLWADEHSYAHHPTDPNVLYVVDDGGVWRSTDFGSSFSFVGRGIQTSQFYNGFSSSATDSLLAIGSVQDHFAWRYDGSADWYNIPYYPYGGDEAGWTAINPKNSLTMYTGWRNGSGISKSTDGGTTFPRASSSFSGSAAWNTPFVLSPSDTSVLYLARSKVFKSTDGALSWSILNGGAVLDGNPSLSMAVAATSPETLYIGTAPMSAPAHVFRTVNGGITWTNITGTLPNRYPMDLAVDPNDARVVYAAMGGFGTGHVFKSTNAGTAWADLTGSLPDVPTTALIVDPLNSSHVYLGNDLGVYLSTDSGESWASFNDGLPEAVIVGDLTISSSNRMLRVATHSCGVYQRKLLDPGTTGVKDGQPYAPQRFALDQNYPNPFNPSTTIGYKVQGPGSSWVRLAVYDILGRETAVLVNEKKAPGSYSVRFNASGVASGVYFYRLTARPADGGQAGNFVQTRRMLLLR